MKTKPKGTKNPLFGMVCGEVLSVDRNSVSQVADLDQLCNDKPWSLARWKSELQKTNVSCHAVDLDGRILAFALVQLGQTKVRVVDLLVHADYRKRGVGRMILDYLDILYLNDVRKVLDIVVPERDVPTQLFLKQCQMSSTFLRGEPDGHVLFQRNFKPEA
jgi:hypothetical protein